MDGRLGNRLLFGATTFITMVLGISAQARIYIVTDTNDTTRVTSLRGAIIDANNNHRRRNVIVLSRKHSSLQDRGQLPPVTFHLNIQGGQTDAAGRLNIRRNLTIMGVGSNVTIDASGLGDRVFQVFPSARLTLNHLIVTGGVAPGYYYFYGYVDPSTSLRLERAKHGGAIFNEGVLALRNCIVTGNTGGGGSFHISEFGDNQGDEGGGGGGIYNSALLIMNDCVIARNASGSGVLGARGGEGGGIWNGGVCRLTRCAIEANQSGPGGAGQGILSGTGGSGGNGGGVYNSGMMILKDCTVRSNFCGIGDIGGNVGYFLSPGNVAGPSGPGGNGGGVCNVGCMELSSCTISGNVSGGGGDGLSGEDRWGLNGGAIGGKGGNGGTIFNTASLKASTCTISSNSCGRGGAGGNGSYRGGAGGAVGGSGGGIHNTGAVDLTSCTIVLNLAGAGGNGGGGEVRDYWASSETFDTPGGQGGNGGGILNVSGGTNVLIRNTLIALNPSALGGQGGTNTFQAVSGLLQRVTVGKAGSAGSGPDLAGDFTSEGFNLISVTDASAGFTNGVNADQVGDAGNPLDPLLGPLQLDGGSTLTHALLPGSPAIDQGNSFGNHRDQRGDHRPYNYLSMPNTPKGDSSDIGAFELHP
ncbi:MAG: hypothetical protein QOJ40_462 [Verrucomicrobiota bacterium]